MAENTTKLGLYKPGGGSTGTNLPDESADIDKLNNNFDKIDAAVGVTYCTSASRPLTPYDGQIIRETDTGLSWAWDADGSAWVSIGVSTITTASISDAGATGKEVLQAATIADALLELGIVVRSTPMDGTFPTGALRFW